MKTEISERRLRAQATCEFYEGNEIQGAAEGQLFAVITFAEGSKFQTMWDVKEAVEIRRIMASDEASEFVSQLLEYALAQRLNELGLAKGVRIECGSAVPATEPKGNA
jgi:Fe2+ transport system protein FeoA